MCICSNGRPSACTNEQYVCVCVGRVDLLFAPIKLRMSLERRDRMLALLNTTCVCVCVGRGDVICV